MAKMAYYPHYPDDYLSDTTYLDLKQHGAYRLLMDYMWKAGQRTGKPVIKDDDFLIAKLLRIRTSEWKPLRAVLIDDQTTKVIDSVDGYIQQKRVLEEWEKAKERSDKARDSVGFRKDRQGKTDTEPLLMYNERSTNVEPTYNERSTQGVTHGPTPDLLCAPVSSPIASSEVSQIDTSSVSELRNSKLITCALQAKRDTDDFDIFYKAYPRKKSPENARKAWKQNKPKRPPLEVLLKAIEPVRAKYAVDPEHVPYPASWLRAGGFSDVPDCTPSLNGNGKYLTGFCEADMPPKPEGWREDCTVYWSQGELVWCWADVIPPLATKVWPLP